MVIVCGVDEAGRGPVIGPLVICGVTIDDKDIHKLECIGVKDSKKVTAKKREVLFPQILEIISTKNIITIYPAEIDDALNSPTLNLNWLEAEKTGLILNILKPQLAIVDCPSNNITAYTQYVEKLLKHKIELQLEHDAERYTIVAAASIVAKVTRDKLIEELKKKYGDFGSGYPSDPKTKKFLEQNHSKYPELFRQSWSSYKKFSQKRLLDF
jgi:ribonuclease HII